MRTLLVFTAIFLSGCAGLGFESEPVQEIVTLEGPLSAGEHYDTTISMEIPAGTWQGFRLVMDSTFWALNAGADETPIAVSTYAKGASEIRTAFGIRWNEETVHWLPWAGSSSGVNLLWSNNELTERPNIEVLVLVGSAASDATAFIDIGDQGTQEAVRVLPELNGTQAVGGTAFRFWIGAQPYGLIAGDIQFTEQYAASLNSDLGIISPSRTTHAAGSTTMPEDGWIFMRLFNYDSIGTEAWSIGLHSTEGNRVYRNSATHPVAAGSQVDVDATKAPHMDLAFEAGPGGAGFVLDRQYSGWSQGSPLGGGSAFFAVTWGAFDVDTSSLGWPMYERLPGEEPAPARAQPLAIVDYV